MNYLIYIEHAAENLQFWLWHRDYTKRFAALSPNERSLAPEWTIEQAEAEALASQITANAGTKKISPEAAAVFQGTDFAHKNGLGNPFNTPPRTPMIENHESSVPLETVRDEHGSILKPTNKSIHTTAAGAFEKADLKWQPCKSTLRNCF